MSTADEIISDLKNSPEYQIGKKDTIQKACDFLYDRLVFYLDENTLKELIDDCRRELE